MCVLLVFCIGVSAAQLALDSTIDPMIPEDEANREIVEKTVGYGWTIYLAFNYETNGRWNRQDYETYYAFEDIQDPEEAKQHQLELVKERLSQYVQEPLKIPVLMWNKFYALWGDLWLSFFYEQGNHIEGFVYKGAGGLIFVGIFLMTVMCNLMALTTALFSRKRKKENNSKTVLLPSIHFKMVVLGVTAALLFSEVMSKYSSHLVMLIYAVWMLELKDFADNSALVQQKITALLPGKQKRY